MEQPAPPPLCAPQSSLPDDVNLRIASLLEASDVCSLGSCSRAWRALCASDCIWIALARDRWPDLGASIVLAKDRWPDLVAGDNPFGGGSEFSPVQGWKDFYISKHNKVASYVSSVVNSVHQCSPNDPLERQNYLKMISILTSMNLSFKDVQMFLLAREHGVLLNVIGLHYSLLVLQIPTSRVTEALQSSQVSDKQVSVRWFMPGWRFFSFRFQASLGELSVGKPEVWSMLNSRATDSEFVRVEISATTVAAAQGC